MGEIGGGFVNVVFWNEKKWAKNRVGKESGGVAGSREVLDFLSKRYDED